MDVGDLWGALTGHWLVATIAAAVVLAVGLAAAVLPEATYRTEATAVIDLSGVTDEISIQQIEFLLPALEEVAESDRVLADAAAGAGPFLDEPPASVDAVADSSVLRVAVTASSPEAAQAWADAIIAEVIESRPTDGPFGVQLLDAAPLRPEPVWPRVAPILVAALALAVIVGVSAALLANRFTQTLDHRQAIRERLGTTIIGEIPRLGRRQRRLPLSELVEEGSDDLLLTALESIRVNLEFRMMELPDRTLSVLSREREEGKTTVVAGLGLVIARLGRPVVAVEADLRRPMLAERLDVLRGYGIGDIASSPSGDITLEASNLQPQVLQPTTAPHLDLLTAGIPVGRAPDTIGAVIPRILAELRADVDRTVLLDCPPLLGAPESAIIVANAPHVVLVVRSNRLDLDDLADSIAQIHDAGGVLLGIVLNRVPRRRLHRDRYPDLRRRSADRIERVSANRSF